MQLKKRQAAALFDKLELAVKDSHHKDADFILQGQPVLRTRVSHGRGDIPPVVVARMRSQLKVTESQLRELIECSMSYEDYILLLKEKGFIDG